MGWIATERSTERLNMERSNVKRETSIPAGSVDVSRFTFYRADTFRSPRNLGGNP